jgi:hypothetical protein
MKPERRQSVFTYDGFKRKQCSLAGDSLVVDSVEYKITSKLDVSGFNTLILIVTYVPAAVVIFLVWVGFSALQDADIVQASIFVFTIIALIPISVITIKMGNSMKSCRSIWRINNTHTLCIEKNDDEGMEARIAALPVPDEDVFPKSTFKVTKVDVLVIVLMLVLSLAIGKGDFSALVIGVVAALFYLRVKDALNDYRNARWRK